MCDWCVGGDVCDFFDCVGDFGGDVLFDCGLDWYVVGVYCVGCDVGFDCVVVRWCCVVCGIRWKVGCVEDGVDG